MTRRFFCRECLHLCQWHQEEKGTCNRRDEDGIVCRCNRYVPVSRKHGVINKVLTQQPRVSDGGPVHLPALHKNKVLPLGVVRGRGSKHYEVIEDGSVEA